jgi:hypothetical protein
VEVIVRSVDKEDPRYSDEQLVIIRTGAEPVLMAECLEFVASNLRKKEATDAYHDQGGSEMDANRLLRFGPQAVFPTVDDFLAAYQHILDLFPGEDIVRQGLVDVYTANDGARLTTLLQRAEAVADARQADQENLENVFFMMLQATDEGQRWLPLDIIRPVGGEDGAVITTALVTQDVHPLGRVSAERRAAGGSILFALNVSWAEAAPEERAKLERLGELFNEADARWVAENEDGEA